MKPYLPFVLSAVYGALLALVGFGAAPVASVLAVLPIPETGHSLIGFALLAALASVVGAIMCLILVVYALVFIFVPSRRRLACRILCFSLAFLLIGVPTFLSFRLVLPIRSAAFLKLAERSKPLVDSIHRYYDEVGEPPSTLADLVPTYIDAVPETGMSAYPDYRYSVRTDPDVYYGNPWVLLVATPKVGLNFDEFMYLPLQNFPTKYYATGGAEKLGDWVYIHE